MKYLALLFVFLPAMSFSQDLVYDLKFGMDASEVVPLLKSKGLVIRNPINPYIYLGAAFEKVPARLFTVDFSTSHKLWNLLYNFGPYKGTEVLEIFRELRDLISKKYPDFEIRDLSFSKQEVKPKDDSEALRIMKSKKGGPSIFWTLDDSMEILLDAGYLDEPWIEKKARGYLITLSEYIPRKK